MRGLDEVLEQEIRDFQTFNHNSPANELNQFAFDIAQPSPDGIVTPTMILRTDDPLAREVIHSINGGDLDSLERMFAAHPELPAAQIGDSRGSKALLHVVTDWPGFFPNGPTVAKLLIASGSNPNARTEGAKHEEGETPLQYAASNDDVEVAEALILGGADIEAPRADSIARGTALENAIGYARVLARGAVAAQSQRQGRESHGTRHGGWE